MNDVENIKKEILEIKSKLSDIQTDLNRFFDLVKQQQHESVLSGIQNNFSSALTSYVAEDIENGLERNMVRNCEMHDTCKSIFNGFLYKNANLLKNKKVDEATISKNQLELQNMRKNAPKKQCEKCFLEVSGLFNKQVLLMRSLQIYSTDEEKKNNISVLPEDLVSYIFESLSSKQRLQILKAVSAEAKSFSAFSEITGLRGGNLLFHLQKLLDAGLILQRHDRGDYMITEKGYKVLQGISDMCLTLEPSVVNEAKST